MERKDSVAAIKDTVLARSDKLFKPVALPFAVDTTFLFEMQKGDSLGSDEVRALAKNIFKHELIEGVEYELNTFYHIDSIKRAGKYQQYVDSLDIGMTKISTAHALGKVQIDPNTLVMVWGLYTSSYEACPNSVTQTAFITVVYKGDVSQTFLLGEVVAFADPPVASLRTVAGKLMADGKINLEMTQINDQDMDQPTVDLSKAYYSFHIAEGKIVADSEKQDSLIQVKRKEVGF
jgi:hypothetical protein